MTLLPEVLDSAIKQSKLGRARKDAQVETCSVFAAALYDVLTQREVPCKILTAHSRRGAHWAHAIIQVGDCYFDSMGEFSAEIYRQRAKIHKSVTVDIEYIPDFRDDCYEPEFDELYSFYKKALDKTIPLDTTADSVSNKLYQI